jgi:hypothetical protein
MNLLFGRLQRDGERVTFIAGSWKGEYGLSKFVASELQFDLPSDAAADLNPASLGEVWCGFRPEDTTLDSMPERLIPVPSKVEQVEQCGAVIYIQARLIDSAIWTSREIVVQVDRKHVPPNRGESLTIGIDPRRVLFFKFSIDEPDDVLIVPSSQELTSSAPAVPHNPDSRLPSSEARP